MKSSFYDLEFLIIPRVDLKLHSLWKIYAISKSLRWLLKVFLLNAPWEALYSCWEKLFYSGKHAATILETWSIILMKLPYNYSELIRISLGLESMIGFPHLEFSLAQAQYCLTFLECSRWPGRSSCAATSLVSVPFMFLHFLGVWVWRVMSSHNVIHRKTYHFNWPMHLIKERRLSPFLMRDLNHIKSPSRVQRNPVWCGWSSVSSKRLCSAQCGSALDSPGHPPNWLPAP